MPDVKWKLHLKSSAEDVYDFLTTNHGRKQFWAESAKLDSDYIHFEFINGQNYQSKILQELPPSCFEIEYFNSRVRFDLSPDQSGGTNLELNNYGVPEAEYLEVYAGWISVLLALKGAIDFGIDLRNHDPQKTWDQLYIEN